MDNITYISYRWSTSRELLQNLKHVIYTGVDLQVIHFYLNSYKTPACKVIGTEIVTHELLHRSSANFQVIKLYLNSCKSRLLQFFYFIGRDSQAVAYEMLPSAACRCVSDTQTCGEMRVLFVLGQPSAEIARVGWANMWCGEMRNVFARSNRLRRSCVSNAQTCGGMWMYFGHGQPSAEIAQVGHPNMWQNANLARPGHDMMAERQKLTYNWVFFEVCKSCSVESFFLWESVCV